MLRRCPQIKKKGIIAKRNEVKGGIIELFKMDINSDTTF